MKSCVGLRENDIVPEDGATLLDFLLVASAVPARDVLAKSFFSDAEDGDTLAVVFLLALL